MSLKTAKHLPYILAILVACGCSKDLRDVIKEHRAKVEPKLAKLAAIRAPARAAPRVTTDSVVIHGPAPRFAMTTHDRQTNVAIEYLEDLDDLQALGTVEYRITSAGTMNRCASLLETHRFPYEPRTGEIPPQGSWYSADDDFEHCEAFRYVFVIRTLAFREPSEVEMSKGVCPRRAVQAGLDAGISDAGIDAGSADGGIADAGAAPTGPCNVFTGGYLSAEVLVFDLENGEQLGGFRYVAESSSQVDIAGASSPKIPLVQDFGTKIRSEFISAVQKWVPSVTMAN